MCHGLCVCVHLSGNSAGPIAWSHQGHFLAMLLTSCVNLWLRYMSMAGHPEFQIPIVLCPLSPSAPPDAWKTSCPVLSQLILLPQPPSQALSVHPAQSRTELIQ